MRIFHVITLSTVGGAQSVVINLANAQIESNEVFVISSDSKEAWKALDPRVKVIGIKQLKRNISWRDSIVLLKLFYYRFKYSPDIVHLHSSKIGTLGRIAFSPHKIIYTVHGFDSIRLANRSFLPIEKLLKNRCAAIVGVCCYDEINLKAERITKNVTYVYNGIADNSMSDDKKVNIDSQIIVQNIRKQYHKVIMCIARDDSPKRIDLFIEVATKLPQYAFVWIGNHTDYVKGENVFLMGQIPLAYQLLRYADIFMLPSNYEGLPMSIIEAFSWGKPVIASNVGGITELLDGSNGYVVDNHTDEFVKKIQLLLEYSNLYDKMSERAREIYLQKFTVTHMLDGYLRIYNKILKR